MKIVVTSKTMGKTYGKTFTYTPTGRFKGDGRVMLEALPQYVRPDTMPMRVRRGAACFMLATFETTGFSTHSGRGATLWVVIEHCETNGISYKVEGEKGLGWCVTKNPPR